MLLVQGGREAGAGQVRRIPNGNPRIRRDRLRLGLPGTEDKDAEETEA
jgi:hypothetical protein